MQPANTMTIVLHQPTVFAKLERAKGRGCFAAPIHLAPSPGLSGGTEGMYSYSLHALYTPPPMPKSRAVGELVQIYPSLHLTLPGFQREGLLKYNLQHTLWVPGEVRKEDRGGGRGLGAVLYCTNSQCSVLAWLGIYRK